MRNDDEQGSRDRSDGRAHRPLPLALRLASGRRRTKCAFPRADRIGCSIERPCHDQNDQRRNRRASSSSLDHDLSRLELAAFALYVEAAAVVKQPEQNASFVERASARAARVDEALVDVESRLEAFTRRVVERFERTFDAEPSPPATNLSRF
jgi:hypothetical protein